MTLPARIKDLADRLLAIGTEGYPPETRRRLLVVNLMAYLIVLSALNYATIYASFGAAKYAPVIGLNLLHAVFALMVPALHRLSENAGAYFIVAFEFSGLFLLTAYLGPESGIQINYIIAAAVPFLALDRSRLGVIAAIVTAAFLLHMAARFAAPETGLMIESDDLLLANVYVLSAITTFGLIAAIIHYALLMKDRAEARTDELLRNILPDPIAEQLKEDPAANIAESYPEATIMFADTVGYTSLAQDLGAERTVAMLNDMFTAFDDLATHYGVEKIKTVGDAYMAVCGAPSYVPDHTARIASLALRLRDAITTISKSHGVPLDLRIGIASGPLVGGVIGRQKLLFDVWGDAVNLAARLQASCKPGTIHISNDVAKALDHRFLTAKRETCEIKDFGTLETYDLLAANVASAERPQI